MTDRIALYDPRGDEAHPFVVKEWTHDLWGCGFWMTVARFSTVKDAMEAVR